ncbi:Lrp/AsnC family transcriptional regulator [Listeria booriae]|uniref:Lrp/AsnC family transcriptional regulator n=1 Tax=Listeria booriae TaxID=1552123 RepID=UPI001623D6E7|nr:Lrp/AsnC family transcriptional regulator [Listeria booriae]MBC1273941.1 Lrp/AsnC family transcriptional regulator [Listeria booriae]
MDQIDRQLLKLLHENARISIVELSQKVCLSRPSVKERIDKLSEQGIIKNFTILPAYQKMGHQISFFSEISNIKWPAPQIEAELQKYPNITEIHIVLGKSNYLVKASVKDTNEMKLLIAEWMTFSDVTTTMILETTLENRFIEE